MPNPEIDRRCAICGASVRPRALFCPQCGQGIEPQVQESKPDPGFVAPVKSALENDLTVEISREAIPDLSETQPLIAVQPAMSAETAPTQALPALQNPPPVTHGADVRGKVEKLRKASSLVIDQAAYDPSLRFVLVGLAFFLLFLFSFS